MTVPLFVRKLKKKLNTSLAVLLILGDKNVVKEFSCGNIAFLSCPCYSIKRREPPERGKAGKLFLYGTPRANLLLHRSEIQRSFKKIYIQESFHEVVCDNLIFYLFFIVCHWRMMDGDWQRSRGVNKALGL